MINISDRIKSLAPSATLAMSQKSNELKAQGIDVINLSVGEPDFPTPTHIKAAAIEAIADNFTFYTPVPGYLTLREAICENPATSDEVTDVHITPKDKANDLVTAVKTVASKNKNLDDIISKTKEKATDLKSKAKEKATDAKTKAESEAENVKTKVSEKHTEFKEDFAKKEIKAKKELSDLENKIKQLDKNNKK